MYIDNLFFLFKLLNMAKQVDTMLPEVQWERVILNYILNGDIKENEVFVDSIRDMNPEFDENVAVARLLTTFFDPYDFIRRQENEKFGIFEAIDMCFEHIRLNIDNESDQIAFLKKIIEVCVNCSKQPEQQPKEDSEDSFSKKDDEYIVVVMDEHGFASCYKLGKLRNELKNDYFIRNGHYFHNRWRSSFRGESEDE